MNKLFCLLFACSLSLTSFGQVRYERVLRNNFWNEGLNVAGLREDNKSISNAGIFGGYEAGEFRDSYMSENEWNIGFGAKTITHLKNFSMIGSFSFENTEANNMCGSMFVNPGYFPVDVIEFTPGHKTFQVYSLMGGISVDLGSNWRIGGLFDYKANNASKRKDLRYSSYNMDFRFAPSIMYKYKDLSLGLSLFVKRKTETIEAEQIGTAQNAPFAFFDEGLMIGSYQAWTGSGVHLKANGVTGMPILQNNYGFGLQFSKGALYADLSMSLFRGKSGERQMIWYRYSGHEASGRIGLRFGQSAIRFIANWQRLNNRKNVYDREVTGGIIHIIEYGSNSLTNRNIINLEAEYEYLSDEFELRANFDINNRQTITAPLYPFVYTQELLTFGAGVESLLRFSKFDCCLKLGFSKGSNKDNQRLIEDNTLSSAFRLEDYYNIANEYLTASRMDLGLALRYNWNFGIYTELNAGLRKAFGLNFINGSMRYSANLVLAYNF